MRISDWSSDVCSSDLEFLAQIVDEDVFGLDTRGLGLLARGLEFLALPEIGGEGDDLAIIGLLEPFEDHARVQPARIGKDDSVDLLGHGRQLRGGESRWALRPPLRRSEEHTSELQSLMR